MSEDIKLIGAGASPYTRKVRAALRYRRIPYQFIIAGSLEEKQLPERPRPLIPGLTLHEGDKLITLSDSTPILLRLEKEFGQRSLKPKNKILALVDSLIEDYGDEWLSKCMFHYRWSNEEDAIKASNYLAYVGALNVTTEVGKKMGQAFRERQTSRIGVVGSNKTTAPVIEESWSRFLKLFDTHLQNTTFFLGERPGAGDFACFGQMTMLVMTDPTPMAIANEVSPRAYAWTERMEDLSGINTREEDWIDIENPPSSLRDILTEIGRVYVPFLIENAKAIHNQLDKVDCEIDGHPWLQTPFVYQEKCLRWLRDEYAALDLSEKDKLLSLLDGTGCEKLFI